MRVIGGAGDWRCGHGGEDWGSGFPSANWMPYLNVSLIIGLNNGESPIGMNSSLSWQQNAVLTAACYCLTADVLYRFRGQPGIGCHASDGTFKDFGKEAFLARGPILSRLEEGRGQQEGRVATSPPKSRQPIGCHGGHGY